MKAKLELNPVIPIPCQTRAITVHYARREKARWRASQENIQGCNSIAHLGLAKDLEQVRKVGTLVMTPHGTSKTKPKNKPKK